MLGCSLFRYIAYGLIVGSMLYACRVTRAETGAETSPQEEFKTAENAYAYGNYGDAIRRFRQLLYPPPGRLRSKTMRREAHKFLGISYYYIFLRNNAATYRQSAEREFTRYLVQAPDARLDPLLYPPHLITFFEQIRQKNKRRLELLLRKHQQQRNATKIQVIPLQVERHYHHYHPLLVAIPFGVPQFMNRHRIKGALLLSGEVVSLAANITAYAVIFSLQIKEGDQRGRFKAQDIPVVTRWQVVQFTSFGIFAALVIYGMIDGIVYLPRRRMTVLPNIPGIDTREFSERSLPSSAVFSISP